MNSSIVSFNIMHKSIWQRTNKNIYAVTGISKMQYLKYTCNMSWFVTVEKTTYNHKETMGVTREGKDFTH